MCELDDMCERIILAEPTAKAMQVEISDKVVKRDTGGNETLNWNL
jgi:hypothetical protein